MDLQKFSLFTFKIFFLMYLIFICIKLYFFILILILTINFIIYFEIVKYIRNYVVYSQLNLKGDGNNELLDFFYELVIRFIFYIIKTYIYLRDTSIQDLWKILSLKKILLVSIIILLVIITKIIIILIYILFCYVRIPGNSQNLFLAFKKIYFKPLFENQILDIHNTKIIIFAGNGIFSYKTPSWRSYENY